ncbi:hypothetical protein VFPYRCLA_021 [Candidatus Vidania fulgoroideae]|nr:hypothetical protein VFPYRCLA_021 [Candidatus Vidania fulgoroideae]
MKKDIFNEVLLDYLKYKKTERFFFFENLSLNIICKKNIFPNIKRISFLNMDWLGEKVAIYVSKINYKKNFFIRDSVVSNKEKIILNSCKKILIITKNISMCDKFLVPINIDPFYKKVIRKKKLKRIGKTEIICKKKKYFIKSNSKNVEKKINLLQKEPGITGNGFYKIKNKRRIIEISKECIREYL